MNRRIFNVVLLAAYAAGAVMFIWGWPPMGLVLVFSVAVAWVLQWLEYRRIAREKLW